MPKMPIVLLSLFGKQCSKCLLFLHYPASRNCAIAVLFVKPHIITSTELYHQGIAPRSQYSDLTPEAAMLH